MRVGRAGAARHDIGIAVHGIDRIGQRDHAIVGENFLHIGRVALGPVGNKNFVAVNRYAAGVKVVLGNGRAQKFLALVGRIAL